MCGLHTDLRLIRCQFWAVVQRCYIRVAHNGLPEMLDTMTYPGMSLERPQSQDKNSYIP